MNITLELVAFEMDCVALQRAESDGPEKESARGRGEDIDLMPAHQESLSIDDLIVECIIEFCVPTGLRELIARWLQRRSGKMKERQEEGRREG